jgi:hypothetical protein
MGFIGLGKLTNVVMGGGALAAAVAILALRRQWRLAVAGVLAFALAFLVGWLAAGQRFGSLFNFFANGLQIVTGYNEAMVMKGWPSEPLLFTFVALLVLGRPFVRAAGMRDTALIVAYVFTAVALAIAYKQGFTRHDRFHALTPFAFLALAAPILALQAQSPPRRFDRMYSGASVIAAFAALLYSLNLNLHHPPDLVAFRILNHFAVASRTALDIVTGAKGLQLRHEQALEQTRERISVPLIVGSVDVYPYDQADIFALGLNWNSRPVFQSYSAYTPKLAALNAAHLSGAAAPDHLLFSVEPIDGRLPALDDGASWVPILERYQLRSAGSRLLLDRSAEPRKTRRQSLGTRHGAGWIELPAGGGLQTAAITLDTRPFSPWSLFSTPPRYSIEVRTGEAEPIRKFLFIPAAALEPFLVSPLVAATADFARLMNPCDAPGPANDVRAVRIVDSAGREVPFSMNLQAVDFIDHADPSRTHPLCRS